MYISRFGRMIGGDQIAKILRSRKYLTFRKVDTPSHTAKVIVMANATPIMSKQEEKFMAFEGLIQWTQCVVRQAERVSLTRKHMLSKIISQDVHTKMEAILATHSEDHFFCIAAYKLLEYRDWVISLDLCKNVDFSKLDKFSESDIKDLRNMREHIVEYFKGGGHYKSRWIRETPEFKADASSVVGPKIGGRLDWMAFANTAKDLLVSLLKEPIPYP